MSHGPVKEGDKWVVLPTLVSRIPVLATWDDHDCCSNDLGGSFPCLDQSQDEFVRHFNLPPSEPAHW